jgi:hypothetical protein
LLSDVSGSGIVIESCDYLHVADKLIRPDSCWSKPNSNSNTYVILMKVGMEE